MKLKEPWRGCIEIFAIALMLTGLGFMSDKAFRQPPTVSTVDPLEGRDATRFFDYCSRVIQEKEGKDLDLVAKEREQYANAKASQRETSG